MALRKLVRDFLNNRILAAGVTFNPQPADPNNGDAKPTLWVDSTTLQFGYQTLRFTNLNLADISDVRCTALHVDPTAEGSATPYTYTAPNNSYLLCDSKHPPTVAEMRFLDDTLDTYRRIVSSNGTLRNIADPDQSITY